MSSRKNTRRSRVKEDADEEEEEEEEEELFTLEESDESDEEDEEDEEEEEEEDDDDDDDDELEDDTGSSISYRKKMAQRISSMMKKPPPPAKKPKSTRKDPRIANSTLRDRISSASSGANSRPRVMATTHQMEVDLAAEKAAEEASLAAEEKKMKQKKMKKKATQLKQKKKKQQQRSGEAEGGEDGKKKRQRDGLSVSAQDLAETQFDSETPSMLLSSVQLQPPQPHPQARSQPQPQPLEQVRPISSVTRDDSNLRMRIACMPTSFDDAREILGSLAIVANATCLNYELGIRMATLAAWDMIESDREDSLFGPSQIQQVIPSLIDRLERLSGSFAIAGCEVFQGCHAARGLVVRALAAILFCENISHARSAGEVMDITEAFKHTCNSTGHALQADVTIPPPVEGLATPDPAYGIMAGTANNTHYYLLLLTILVKNSDDVPVTQAKERFGRILEWMRAARARHARSDASSWFNHTIDRMIAGLADSNILA